MLLIRGLSMTVPGEPPLVVAGVTVPHDPQSPPDPPVALWLETPLAELSQLPVLFAVGASPVIVRSGIMPGEGWERFGKGAAEFVDGAIGRALSSGAKVWVRPHAADVVSDVPSMAAMLRRWEGKVWAVVDPGALMTAGMMGRAEDHLERMLEAASHEGVAAVVGPDFGAEAEVVRAWEKHRGMVIALKKPVIVKEEWAGRARAWLEEKTPG